jgi:hypothetical protein
MKTPALCLLGAALSILPLYAQQQVSVNRHPGEHLHYNVTLTDGDTNKVATVSVVLKTVSPQSPNQPSAHAQFAAPCQKSSDPKTWTCDVEIPQDLRDGDYQLYRVNIGSIQFGTYIDGDFHVPLVRVENPNTFKAPTKVTITPQP